MHLCHLLCGSQGGFILLHPEWKLHQEWYCSSWHEWTCGQYHPGPSRSWQAHVARQSSNAWCSECKLNWNSDYSQSHGTSTPNSNKFQLSALLSRQLCHDGPRLTCEADGMHMEASHTHGLSCCGNVNLVCDFSTMRFKVMAVFLFTVSGLPQPTFEDKIRDYQTTFCNEKILGKSTRAPQKIHVSSNIPQIWA